MSTFPELGPIFIVHGIVVTILSLAFCGLFRVARFRAATRHAIWFLLLATTFVPFGFFALWISDAIVPDLASPVPAEPGSFFGSESLSHPAPPKGSSTFATPTWSTLLLTPLQRIHQRVPSPPPELWWSGILLLLSLRLGRSIAFRRSLRRASRPDDETIAFVRDQCRRLGLRRCPRIAIVDREISPAIFGTLRPQLLLPRTLWRQLSHDRRIAVVLHELIHLKRRDPQTSAFATWATLLVWWNPTLWWVRRRLQFEVELSTDARVADLMGPKRREYAEALLESQSFLATSGETLLVPGTPLRGRTPLSRRLEEIMRSHGNPRLSPAGLLIPGGLLVVGVLILSVSATGIESDFFSNQRLSRLCQTLARSDDAEERRRAADAIGNVGLFSAAKDLVPQAIPFLIESLESDRSVSVRREAADALGRIGPSAQAAVPALQRRLIHSTSPRIRREAADALGRIGPSAGNARPTLEQTFLNDPDPRVRREAGSALSLIDPSP